MVIQLGNYFVALTVLLCGAAIYHVTVARYLVPPVVENVVLPAEKDMVDDHKLSDLFAADAWQNGPCKRLQTTDGMLMFQEWNQVSDDQWELKPVTIVIGRGMSSDQEESPIILESSQGASIRFSKSLDMLGGGAPEIDYAHLRGRVSMRQSPAVNPADVVAGTFRTRPEPTLSIATSDVKIDRKRIWTTARLKMRIGDVRMSGRDLTILLAATPNQVSQVGSPTDVLDRMELIYLDELTLPISGPISGAGNGDDEDVSVNDIEGVVDRIALNCSGAVSYDFALDELLLDESVSFVRSIGGRTVDVFQCNYLTAVLRDPMNTALPRRGPLDWIVMIEALGQPAVVRSETYGVTIESERIKLDGVDGQLQAFGQSGVNIAYQGVECSLPNFSYLFDPDHPSALGAIVVDGPGGLRNSNDQLSIRSASWREGIRIQPRPTVDPDVSGDVYVSIDGDLRAQFSDGGLCQADRLHGWFKSVPAMENFDIAANSGNEERRRGAGTSPDSAGPLIANLRPDSFEAAGNVTLDTELVRAETEVLDLFFSHVPAASDGDTRSSKDDASLVVEQPASGSGRGDGNPDSANRPEKKPVARSRPLIRGRRVAAKMNMNSQGVTATDLSVTGDVRIEHHLMMGTQPMDVKLSGDELRMINDAGSQVLELGSGVESPARLELGDGYFVGPKISVRLSDNFISIADAGEFRVPTSVLPSSLAMTPGSADSPGTPAAVSAGKPASVSSGTLWRSAPLCKWTGGMSFDGRQLILNEAVTISAAVAQGDQEWEIFLSSDQLIGTMQNRVDLSDANDLRSAVITEVALVKGDSQAVTVEAVSRAADGILESRHLFSAPRLSMLPAGGGSIVGAGPGWYRLWTRQSPGTKSTDAARLPGGVVDAGGGPADRAQTLTAVHMAYQESMVANLATRDLRFNRGVRVGFSPIDRWDESIDVDRMSPLADGTGKLTCDQIRVSMDPRSGLATTRAKRSDTAMWEMEALGTVAVHYQMPRGLYQATASRASYSSGRQMFVTEEAPQRPIVMKMIRPDGSEGFSGQFKSVTFDVATQQMDAVSYGLSPGVTSGAGAPRMRNAASTGNRPLLRGGVGNPIRQ